MKATRVGSWLALTLVMLAVHPAAAAEKPINLSLFPPVAIAKPEDSVSAFRLNLIYGQNTAVKVVDLGLVNHVTTGTSSGLQWGFVNITETKFSGLQLGAVNYNQGTAEGFVWGSFNYAGTANGLQLALVNYAEQVQSGVQIGFINIIKKGGMFPVMVVANWAKK